MRNTFTFEPGEKDPLNRLYRRLINGIVSSRYLTTDRFYSIQPLRERERLFRILASSREEDVEIEVHPENAEELAFLTGGGLGEMLRGIPMGAFRQLGSKQVIQS